MTRDLYERYGRQIYAYCLHQLGSREEAEDAVQTTFMNAFRGLQRGVVPELESAWLYKIANNVILTRRRSSFRRRRVETPGDLDALQDLLPAPQRDRDELLRLQEALRAMPEQQRKALLLREWQGLSYREIAEQMELSQSAVETLLFRARRTLAAGLTEEAPAPKKGLARLRGGLDLSSLLAAAKALLSGGAAVKVAVTAAAVATTAVTADRELVAHAVKPEPKAPVAALAAPAVPHPHVASATVAAQVAVAPVARRVRSVAPPKLASAHRVAVPVVAASPTPVATETTDATPVVATEPPDPAPTTTTTAAPPAPVVATPEHASRDSGRGHSADAPGQQRKTADQESSSSSTAAAPPAEQKQAKEQSNHGQEKGHGKSEAAPVVPAPPIVAPDPTTTVPAAPVVTTPATDPTALVPTTTPTVDPTHDRVRGNDGRGGPHQP